MKHRTKIGKMNAILASKEKIENNINTLFKVLGKMKYEIYHCPSKNIIASTIKPAYYADLIIVFKKSFMVIKYLNRQYPVDITNKIWKEIVTDQKIDQKTSGIKNWYDITLDLKFKLLKNEFTNYNSFNCIIFNKMTIGKNQNKYSFIGKEEHFPKWILLTIAKLHRENKL